MRRLLEGERRKAAAARERKDGEEAEEAREEGRGAGGRVVEAGRSLVS